MDTLTQTKLLNLAKQGQTGTGLAINGVFSVVTLDHESIAFIEDRATVTAGRDIDLAASNKNLIVNVAGAQALGGTDAIGVAVAVTVVGTPDSIVGSPEKLEDRAELDDDGELLGVASVRAFIGDAQQTMGPIGTGGITGKVTAGRDVKLTATSDPAANEIWTLAVAGAGSSTQPAGTSDLSAPGDAANNVDVSAAGAGAINVVDRRTIAYVRDLDKIEVGGHLRLDAQDAAFLVASAGSTIGTGNDTIGASFALNSVTPEVRAFTAFVAIKADDVSLIAGSNMTLLSFESTALTGGGSGLTIAASFNLSLANADVEAGFEDTTTLVATGDITISATSAVDVVAVAGTAAFAAGSGFGVGAALALVIVDSSALAYPGIDLATAGAVSISASSDVRNRAFSAVNGSTATSAATTAPGGQLVVAIITSDADASIIGVAVSAGGAVSVSASSKVRSAAGAIGDSSHSDGAKDAAIATSIVNSDAVAQISGDTPVTAGGALTISAANSGTVATTGNAGTAQAGAGIGVAIVGLTTRAFLNSAAPVSAASMLLSADTDSDVSTTGSASQGGSTANDASPSSRTNGNAQTSDGTIAVAGALAFTKLDAPTEAFISSPATATGQIKLHARGAHSSKAKTDASAAAGSPGVGVAISVALTDVSAKAYIAATTVNAGSLVLEALNQSGATYEVTASSGTSPSSATVIAGGLALHVLTSETSALLHGGSTVTLSGGDASFTATSVSTSIVKALPAGPTSGGGLGIGASVALNIVEDETVAGLQAGATLTGADDLSLSASSTDSMVTEAEAGASAGTAIVPAVAISISNVTTTALLGAGTPLTIAGNLTAQALQSASVATSAKGTAASTGTGVGVAFALTFATHLVSATPARSFTAGGSASLTARGYSSTSSSATASASGAPDTASSNVDGQAAGQRSFADSTAAANGAAGSATPSAPSAATSSGSISVAAAIAINLVTSTVTATIPELLSATSGGALSLTAAAETDASANADAAASSGGSANVGAAVAINLANHTADASIGAEATVSSTGLTLSASTGGPAGSAANNTNSFGATAVSGAAGGSVGVAGSFALNVANLKTLALLRHNPARGPPVVNAHGSAVSLSATSSSSSTVTALPKTAAGGSSVGIGASVALNLVDDLAEARVDQGAQLLNGGAVTLTATNSHALVTQARAGATSGSVAVAPAVAISIADVRSNATLGTGPATSVGSLAATAGTTVSVSTVAAGASAGSVSIGLALALTLANPTSDAWSQRNLTSAGAVSFSAAAVVTTNADATAGANGAPDSGGGNVDSQVAGQQSFASSTQVANGGGGSAASPPSASTSSGTVSVGAAVAVNVTDVFVKAVVLTGVSITAAGALTLNSSVTASAKSKADGSATGGGTANVGVGVAITLANLLADASIAGTVSATSISLTASTNGAGGFGAEASSGAGGGSVGVAGSLGLNIVNIDTLALLRTGSSANASGGAVLLNATSTASSTAKALPKTTVGGSSVGIGASVALNLVDDLVQAGLQNGAILTNAGAVTLLATNSHALTTEAKAGATGGSVAVAPAVAISIADVRSNATLGTGPAASVGSLAATASTTVSVSTVASGASAGSVSIGLALALTLANPTSDAWSQRNLTSAGAVSFTAGAVVTTNADATAGANGAPDSGSGNVDSQVAGQQSFASSTAGCERWRRFGCVAAERFDFLGQCLGGCCGRSQRHGRLRPRGRADRRLDLRGRRADARFLGDGEREVEGGRLGHRWRDGKCGRGCRDHAGERAVGDVDRRHGLGDVRLAGGFDERWWWLRCGGVLGRRWWERRCRRLAWSEHRQCRDVRSASDRLLDDRRRRRGLVERDVDGELDCEGAAEDDRRRFVGRDRRLGRPQPRGRLGPGRPPERRRPDECRCVDAFRNELARSGH